MTHRVLPASLAALFVGAALLTGCSGSIDVGSTTLDQEAVEEEAATQLAETVDNGVVPDISCPDDLDSEVGATMTCELTVEGDTDVYPVTIEVTAVEDGNASFDVQVGDDPIG